MNLSTRETLLETSLNCNKSNTFNTICLLQGLSSIGNVIGETIDTPGMCPVIAPVASRLKHISFGWHTKKTIEVFSILKVYHF
jgi:hypothetical protein